MDAGIEGGRCTDVKWAREVISYRRRAGTLLGENFANFPGIYDSFFRGFVSGKGWTHNFRV